jgi:hypothetical protein
VIDPAANFNPRESVAVNVGENREKRGTLEIPMLNESDS